MSSHDKVLLTFLPGVAESSHSRGKFAANSMVEKVIRGTGGDTSVIIKFMIYLGILEALFAFMIPLSSSATMLYIPKTKTNIK